MYSIIKNQFNKEFWNAQFDCIDNKTGLVSVSLLDCDNRVDIGS